MSVVIRSASRSARRAVEAHAGDHHRARLVRSGLEGIEQVLDVERFGGVVEVVAASRERRGGDRIARARERPSTVDHDGDVLGDRPQGGGVIQSGDPHSRRGAQLVGQGVQGPGVASGQHDVVVAGGELSGDESTGMPGGPVDRDRGRGHDATLARRAVAGSDSFHCYLLGHGQPVNKVNRRPGRGRAGSSRDTTDGRHRGASPDGAHCGGIFRIRSSGTVVPPGLARGRGGAARIGCGAVLGRSSGDSL
jgi:hypothetical protein